MHKNDVRTYSSGSKFLHWLIAFIVILMLLVSFFLGDLQKKYQPFAYMIHKSFGLTVLFLMMARFFWIWRSGKPALPKTVSTSERFLSRIVQYGFYVFLICMPICGWIMSVAGNKVPSYFDLFKMPLPIAANKVLEKWMDQSHKTIAWILIALIFLHIAGALKHHYIDKDKVLKHMLPGG